MKRIFHISLLLSMIFLAMFTMMVFAEEGSNGSYSLVINKVFADNTPEAAKDLSYKFRITGEIMKRDETIPFIEEFTLPQANVPEKDRWKYTYYSDAPIRATVTELTSGLELGEDANGYSYNMGKTTCTTETLLHGTEPQRLQLKNNGKITLSRPQTLTEHGVNRTLTPTLFHLYNSPYPGHQTVNETVDKYFWLNPTGEEVTFNKLCAGIYTLEELRAPDGYSVQVGPREENVAAGSNGSFYINGNPGRLTLTAGGVSGDGGVHAYTVNRTPSDSTDTVDFRPRSVTLASGTLCTMDDLPKGSYTVTERTYQGINGYTLTVPQTTESALQTKYSSALCRDGATNYKSFKLSENVTYVQLEDFGPLYDANTKILTNSDTYTEFRFGVTNQDGNISFWKRTREPFEGKKYYSINAIDARLNTDKKLYFSVRNVNSENAAKIRIRWKEFTEKDVTSKITNSFGTSVTKTVDKRGWMIFSKESDPNSADHTYCYTITSTDNKSMAECKVTDTANDTELPDRLSITDSKAILSLKPGETLKLEGLKAGTYSITETVDEDQPDGFKISIEGCAINVVEAGKSYPITVHGKRDLYISKPACSPDAHDDGGRFYTFKIICKGTSDVVTDNIKVKAGESTKFEQLPEGSYRIVPVDEADPFQMSYTDSSSINGIAKGSITFTNTFTTGKGSYRYIHEYYLKSGDQYSFEGSREITHVRGLDFDEDDTPDSYQALDLEEEPEFAKETGTAPEVYTYTHFDEGYGEVVTPASTRNFSESDLMTDDLDEEEDPDDEDQSNADNPDKTNPDDLDNDNKIDSDDPDDEDRIDSDDPDDEDRIDSDNPDDEGKIDPDNPNDEGNTGDDTGQTDKNNPDDKNDQTGDDGSDHKNDQTGGDDSNDRNDLPDGDDSNDRNDLPGGGDSDNKNQPEGDGSDSKDQEIPSNAYTAGSLAFSRYDSAEMTNVLKLSAVKPASMTEPGHKDTSAPDDSVIDDSKDKDNSGIDNPDDKNHPGIDNPDDRDPSATDNPDDKNPSDINNPDDKDPSDTDIPDDKDPSDTDVPDQKDADDSNDTGKDDASDKKENSADQQVSKTKSRGNKLAEQLPADAEEQTIHSPITRPDGIIEKGFGTETGIGTNGTASQNIVYMVNPTMDRANVTENGNNIIIMRYYREVPKDEISGTFKVLHVYYYRDYTGDHLEGASGYETRNGILNNSYIAGSTDADGNPIQLIETPDESVVSGHYTYTHDNRPQYGVLNPNGSTGAIKEVNQGGYTGNGYACRPDTNWDHITATKNEEQVIILRYYRETRGSYKIVHEYYTREKGDGAETKGEAPAPGDSSTGTDTSEEEEFQTTEPSEPFHGTLDYDGEYSYRFEGTHAIESRQAKVASTYTYETVEKNLKYNAKNYTFHDAVYGETNSSGYDKIADKQWATATEDGTQIIILRYYRDADDDPIVPTLPVKPDGVEPPTGTPIEFPPEQPDKPAGSTETDSHESEQPDQPSDTLARRPDPDTPDTHAELPDPNDPNAPDSVTILEDGVSKTYTKVWNPDRKEWTWVLAEDVSPASAPRSGDDSRPGLWIFLTIASLISLGALGFLRIRRKKQK